MSDKVELVSLPMLHSEDEIALEVEVVDAKRV